MAMTEVEEMELRQAILQLKDYEKLLLVLDKHHQANEVRCTIDDLATALRRVTFARLRRHASKGA